MNTSIFKLKFVYSFALIITLLLSSAVQMQAQTAASPAMMQLISSELQKRGLSENEVRTRLLQKGIDLETLPPAELPKYQSRVIAVLDELEAEKKLAVKSNLTNNNVAITSPSASTSLNVNNSQSNLTSPKTTPQEALAEANQQSTKAAFAKTPSISTIYGHSLFTDKSLEVFRTTDGAQAPETYILGEGDEIHITIFGASQTDIQQRIAADGAIKPSGVAKIFLKGLTLEQARELIKKSLSSSYLFRGDQLAVTVVTARTIMVNVFGEANMTGGFNLSALNSAFNALSAAGGINLIGSVRNIQLIRGNSRKNMDLYAFMKDPATQYTFDLQNNDILFVPVAQKIVSIEGAVNRPMSYEMLSSENISDLFQFAGGFKMNAYPNFVQIKRFENGEEKLLEWNLADIQNGKTKVALLNGDVVRIKAINKPMEQYVEIEGSVYYPGRFDLSANPSLTALLLNAKPNYQAKTDFLLVERLRPDSSLQMLTIPFPNPKAGIPDFELQARDKIQIMNQASYRDLATIAVTGHVRAPFEKPMAITDRITVRQAIEMAGGLKTSVFQVAYIFRKNLFNPSEIKYIRMDLNISDNVLLQAGDQLNIYNKTSFTNVGDLKIFGAVKNPKAFTFDPSMSINDLIINAGGFNVGAAYNRVEVFRTVLSPTEKTKMEMITLEVDSNYNLITPKEFSLQPYDQVVVRLTPDFTLNRTVELNGQVKYPGVYVLKSNETHLSDVIKMAGGLLDNADPYGSNLFRTYNKRGNISMSAKEALRHKRSVSKNPILFEGDVININRLENTVAILETGTRMAQFSINTSADSIKNIVFQGHHSAAWYIRHFAGGFQKNADRRSLTVTYPNDQMESTKTFLGMKFYPTVVPGATITMRMDVERVQEELDPKKKVDLESTVSRSLSTMMSTLSIILLLQRL